jgi:hypothetical protein
LNELFKSDQIVNAKLYLKKNKKQYFGIKPVPLNTLSAYLPACQYIIHRILEGQRNRNCCWFVNLPSPRQRTTATSILDDLKIIEINHSYNYSANRNKKRFSKSYQISDAYYGDIQQYEGVIHSKGDHSKVNGDIKDVIQYKDYNDNNLLVTGSSSPVVLHPPYILYQIKNLESVPGIVPKITVGHSTGKVFSPVTRMKKELRKRTLLDDLGKPLTDVDFRSSHLQHLILVISDDLEKGVYVPTMERSSFLEYLNHFKADVLSTDFYQNICDEYLKRFDVVAGRDKAKLFVMYWLNNSQKNWRGVKLLNQMYPEISEYIRTVNGETKNQLSIKLQRSEAYLVNNLVIDRLASEYPESVCYTIFDGFMVEGAYKDVLLDLIREESLKYFGFEARVKVTIPMLETANVA